MKNKNKKEGDENCFLDTSIYFISISSYQDETLDLSIVSIVRRFANSVESEAKRGGGGVTRLRLPSV